MSKATEIILTTIATYVMFKLLDKFSLMKVKEMIQLVKNAIHYVFYVLSWGKITTAIIGAIPVYYVIWVFVIPFLADRFEEIPVLAYQFQDIIASDILLRVWVVNYFVFSLAMTCGYHQVLEERENADRHYLFGEGFLASLAALMLCLTPPLILTPMITLITIRDFWNHKRSKNTENDLSGQESGHCVRIEAQKHRKMTYPDKNPDIVICYPDNE